MRAAALTPTAGFAAAGLTGVGQIGHPGLVWLGFWDGEREREAAIALAGSAQCAEAAESKRGGEGRRDRKREGVGEVPLTTAKLRSGDVVEEAERNGGTAASSELDEGGGFGS